MTCGAKSHCLTVFGSWRRDTHRLMAHPFGEGQVKNHIALVSFCNATECVPFENVFSKTTHLVPALSINVPRVVS